MGARQRRSRPGRGAPVAAVAVASVLLAGCTTRPAASALTTTRPPATTTPATTTTTTTLPTGAAPYTWQADTSSALDLGGGSTSTLSAIVAPGASGDWLIAGTRSTSAGTTTATVWTSRDGLNWSRFALPKPPGTTSTAARAATNWGNGVVVVGSAGTGADMTAAVWVSPDRGQPFQSVPQSTVFESPATVPAGGTPDGVVMDALAAGALGLFASGTVDGRTTMWFSTGGQRWQVIPGADGTIDKFTDAVINDIVPTPHGIFAAGSYLDGNRLSGELWSSSDGIHWSSGGGWFAGTGDRVITSVVDLSEAGNAEPGTPGPTGMVALGGVRVGATWQPASWISPNGVSWSQSSEDFPLDGEPSGSPGAVVYAAVGAEGRLLAVGGSPGRQRLWQSSGGLAWSSLALPAAGTTARWHLGLVASSGHTIVAVDNVPGQPYVITNDGSQWHQPSATGVFGVPLATAVPTSLVADDGTLTLTVEVSRPGLVIGSGKSWVAVLSSANGRLWRTTNANAFHGGTVNELLGVPDGLLAVGAVPLPGHGGDEALTGAFADLSSDHGATWADQLINPATIGGPAPAPVPRQSALAATTSSTGAGSASGSTGAPVSGPLAAVSAGRVGDSQFVVGQAGPQAVEWFSPDGNTWEPPRPLDSSPELGIEQPLFACTTGDSAVVVGRIITTARGSLPAAWSSTDGSSWTGGIFTPAPPAGSTTSVEGCLWTGNGFIAYGETGYAGVEQPVLWVSSDGITWTEMPSTFTGLASNQALGAQAAPLDSIVWGTSTWLGLSGQGDLPWQVWPVPVGGLAGAEPTPLGLWSSVDAGNSWQQVATSVPTFTPALFAQADAAISVGQHPVVAGTVDGRLRVWVGTPPPAPPTD